MNSDIIKKEKLGLKRCALNDILFAVEMIENPASANTEYQHIVRGYGDFEITRPEYIKRMEEVKRGEDKGKMKEVTHVSYPKAHVSQLDLNYCSHRYELVENADIFPPVRKVLADKGIEFTETYMHMNYARFYAEYTIEDHKFEVAPETLSIQCSRFSIPTMV